MSTLLLGLLPYVRPQEHRATGMYLVQPGESEHFLRFRLPKEEEVIRIMNTPPHTTGSQDPHQAIGHSIEKLGRRSEAKWEGHVLVDIIIPLHAKQPPISWVDWYIPIGALQVVP